VDDEDEHKATGGAEVPDDDEDEDDEDVEDHHILWGCMVTDNI
jgi:hypothetical protein